MAIDDFERGYSALSYLRDLPIDEVKLDRQFITPMLSDRRAATIVRAVIDLSHDLGVTTVARGVETSKPVGVADIIDLIRGVKLCCAANTAGCCGSCTRGGVTA